FWTMFGVTMLVLKLFFRRSTKAPASAPTSREEHTASHSRGLIWFHGIAFFVMYFGIYYGVILRRVPVWFAGQRLTGTMVMSIGAVLASWTLVYFRSWRFRATLDKGHELATGGPFAIVRHPIYMSLNLLALGSAIWVPSVIMWSAVV